MKVTRFVVVMFLLLSCLVGPVWAKGGNGNGGGAIATLSETQAELLIFLREEEKLARDVYIKFAAKYGTPIFITISESEQRHIDSVGKLIETYGLEDPIVDDTPGEFTNPTIDGIYDELLEKGLESLTAALEVGVEIEEMDITDIEEMLRVMTQADIKRVLQNLLAGSYNHLDAFNNSLGL